jgi:signal peptidase I
MLYNRGQRWLQRSHVMGRAWAFLPYVGMVTIVMNDYPWLKVTVIGALGLLCLLGFDE